MRMNLPSATLRELVKLSERKDALLAQIQEIDREMDRLQDEQGASESSARSARVTVSRGNRKAGQSRRGKRTS